MMTALYYNANTIRKNNYKNSMIIGIEIGNMWRRYNQPTYQSYLK
jgi:hypothetical protein